MVRGSGRAVTREWNVGVVGYGWVTGAHITALQLIPGVRVAAVCSSRELDPEVLLRTHGVSIEVVHDLDALLGRDDIDVIDICSRSNLHSDPGHRSGPREEARDRREADRTEPRRASRAPSLPSGILAYGRASASRSGVRPLDRHTQPSPAGPARGAALRRGRLLRRGRPCLRSVRVESPQGRRREQPLVEPGVTPSTAS